VRSFIICTLWCGWEGRHVSCSVRGCIQKFPDWVANEIRAYICYYSLRSNTNGYGNKIHYTDSHNSDKTAASGRELYHLQFSLQDASPETCRYTLVVMRNAYKLLVGREHAAELSADGRLLLCKWSLKEQGVSMWIGFICTRIESTVLLLRTWRWTFVFHERRGISWSGELLLASQEGFCSTEAVS
jgi:hypothetical protein